MKTVNELTIPGYYWWLPECSLQDSDKAEHWTIVSWHPLDSSRQKSGRFVGPLEAPVVQPKPEPKRPICEECGLEMHEFACQAGDEWISGWSCDGCGWSFDNEE